MIRKVVKRMILNMGYVVKNATEQYAGMEGFDPLYQRCRPYTMTSKEEMFALHKATEYLIRHDIPGAFVECGVCKGGSAMGMALSLMQMGATDRQLFLYDTYAGMSEPTSKDVNCHGAKASGTWGRMRRKGFNAWMFVPLETVKENLRSTGYPEARVTFVKGPVADTIPHTAPERIALLRLDTDWYESTYHGLRHLFPLLSPGGVLIVDDYGHWKGAREATDQYLAETGTPFLLNRIDCSVRLGVKIR